MPEMIATPESSNVLEIGYDAALEELWVVFSKSGTYIYEAVPEFVWEEFKAAGSKGHFVHQVLRPGYGFHR